MTTLIKQSLVGGIAGTLMMTLFMFIGQLAGMPKMNPAEMLTMMMHIPLAMGWVLHFFIGITFALMYALIFAKLLKRIRSHLLKGIIFGLVAFLIAQIAMTVMGPLFGDMPPVEGGMILMAMGSILGHIIFGIVVAYIVKGEV